MSDSEQEEGRSSDDEMQEGGHSGQEEGEVVAAKLAAVSPSLPVA